MLEINDLFFSLATVRPPPFPGSPPRASGDDDDAAGRAGRDPQREEIRTYFEGGDALAWRGGGINKLLLLVPRQKLTTERTDMPSHDTNHVSIVREYVKARCSFHTKLP